MIPANAVASQLQAYARPAETPLVQAVDAVQEIRTLFTIGEQVRAQVNGLLPNGRFAVLIKDQTLDLNLPRNTQPGEELDMEVVATSPRLAFLLSREQAPSPQRQSQASNNSAPVQLSQVARFLGDLFAEEAQSRDAADQAVTLPGKLPLMMSGTPVNTQQLALALAQAVSDSGLFYESHLAQWLRGERDLGQLLRESAARGLQAEPRVPGERTGMSVGAAATQSGSMAKEAQEDNPASPSLQFLSEQEANSLENISPSARQMIQQQLHVLDQRQLHLQGMAWQEQPFHLLVEEDRGQSGGQDEAETDRVWHTRLRMDLPRLGEIDIWLRLSSNHRIDVNFRVANPDAAARIRDAQPHLQRQFDAAGLALTDSQVALVAGDA